MGLDFENKLTIRRLNPAENIPYELLLMADDAVEAIDKYIYHSQIFICEIDNRQIALYVLKINNDQTAEIKNLAVIPEFRGFGIGTFLINHAIENLTSKGIKTLFVGTGETSEGPLKLYRKLGFTDYTVIKDFFIDNYPRPIYENGILLRDMIVLKRDLSLKDSTIK